MVQFFVITFGLFCIEKANRLSPAIVLYVTAKYVICSVRFSHCRHVYIGCLWYTLTLNFTRLTLVTLWLPP